MVVQPASEDDASRESPPSRQSEHSRYVFVKNHVRQVRVDAETTLRKDAACGPDARQQAAPAEAEVAADLAALRRAHAECRRLLRHIETKYGERLGLRDDDGGCPNTRIVFDEEGRGRVVGRRAAVERLRAARAERADALRWHRAALMQHVRACPRDALAFAGSNLDALPGYGSAPPPT